MARQTQSSTPLVTSTYGPSCKDDKTLAAMRDAGMRACRLNTAFGEPREWDAILARLNKLKVPTMLDLKGRQLRLSAPTQAVAAGEMVSAEFGSGEIMFNHDLSMLKPGDEVLLDKGLKLKVRKATPNGLVMKAMNAGVLGSQRAKFGRHVELPPLALTDMKAIVVGRRAGAGFLILSEVDTAQDVFTFKETVEHVYGKESLPQIVLKIESVKGVQNLHAIASKCRAAGIAFMVLLGRGDLRTEVSFDVVPIVQKGIAQYCGAHRIPLIVATKMLESMMVSPDPSQSDCSDVANAVLEGDAGVMLTDETAVGKYPVEATKVAARIVRTALDAKASGRSYEQLMTELLKR